MGGGSVIVHSQGFVSELNVDAEEVVGVCSLKEGKAPTHNADGAWRQKQPSLCEAFRGCAKLLAFFTTRAFRSKSRSRDAVPDAASLEKRRAAANLPNGPPSSMITA